MEGVVESRQVEGVVEEEGDGGSAGLRVHSLEPGSWSSSPRK